MRIFVIRHGDPDYANDTLTPAGHLEAQALARRMKRLGLDRIYSSPMGRAQETMRYTARALEMPHAIEEWTREVNEMRTPIEPYANQMAWDLPGELLRTPGPLHAENWHTHPAMAQPAYLAAFQRLQAASDEFLARHGYQREGHRYRILQPNRLKIALFCHAGFALTWLSHLLTLPLHLAYASFALGTTSVTTVLFDERSPEFATPRVIGLGDVSHLHEANLPIIRPGLKANRE